VVQSPTIAKLKKGKPIFGRLQEKGKKRSCKTLTGKYITYAYTDVFYVEKCKKRQFADWATYVEHKKNLGRENEEIVVLTWDEYTELPLGPEIESIVDQEFERLLSGEAGVDVIPIDEACRGLNGKDVSYIDRIYKIQKCRKREYNAMAYSIKRGDKKLKLRELRPEQWLSLPDGKPMDKSLEENPSIP